MLTSQGKGKAAQQVMQLLVKDMESIGTDETQDKGIYRFMKNVAKDEGNIIMAFGNWIGNYLSQEIKPDNALQFGKVMNFILKVITEIQASSAKIYENQESLFVKLFKILLDPAMPEIPEIPSIALQIFLLFPKSHS